MTLVPLLPTHWWMTSALSSKDAPLCTKVLVHWGSGCVYKVSFHVPNKVDDRLCCLVLIKLVFS